MAWQMWWPNWWRLWPRWQRSKHCSQTMTKLVVFSFGPFEARWYETSLED